MPIEHKNLTDPELHEPKGVSSASANLVYVSNGAGSGTWQNVSALVLDPSFSGTSVESVTLDTTNGIFRLVNDNASPGPSKYYGTDETGTKGWFDRVVSYTSTPFTITANTVFSFTHGLGAVPTTVQLIAKCIIDELNYKAGDYIVVSQTQDIIVGYNSTDVWCTVVNPVVTIPNKLGTASGTITPANWEFNLRCEK